MEKLRITRREATTEIKLSSRERSALRNALVAMGVITVATTAVPEDASARTKEAIHESAEALSEHDIDLIAQNVYHEARGESVKGQLAVAQVTLARVASKRFGKSVADVIFAPNQFSWTMDEKILMGKMNERTYNGIRALIGFAAGNRTPEAAVRTLSLITGLPANTHFYKRRDWDENSDDPRMSEKTKEMFRKLTVVGDIGEHRFYTE